MGRTFRRIAIFAAAGMVLGGLFGLLIGISSDCHIDHDGTLPAGACVRFLGTYFSTLTKFVVAGAIVGGAVGLAAGIFFGVPLLHERKREGLAVHPLEIPAIWFGVQLVGLMILIPALLFWVPDPGEWPEAARWAVWILVLFGLTAMNYAIRRRFIPH
jgi:drug/metabolite transporter (DMT)-like permease